ncbi:permease of phosphate ABC transporter [Acetivibrio sp. MSJd-27]|uniref:permease of phosphate ABC transporter n=1 Tax=Acetivibrio sp. MSJd-27 TaxID=2841523 RepID=UPI001C0F6203|nr:permease of phosphate ABC transporter [Acetivibrio sp. MSJd-27]MBU5450511.1 permease of phosphate ABC transporter [Acetivibrio sp. MSJd-27]
MKKLFAIAKDYIRNMTLWDMSFLKFCLYALGMTVGLLVPKKYKKTALIGTSAVFTATYIPLMAKFFRILIDGLRRRNEERL